MHNINTSETINTRPPQGPCAGRVTNRSLQLLPVNMLHSLILKVTIKTPAVFCLMVGSMIYSTRY